MRRCREVEKGLFDMEVRGCVAVMAADASR